MKWVAALAVVALAALALFSFSQGMLSGTNAPQEIITIPVSLHLVKDASGFYTSGRDEESIRQLFERANVIWVQADIYFRIDEVVVTDVSTNAIPNALNGNYQELAEHQNFEDERVNVFLVQSLNGVNGLALAPIRSVLIADYTTVHDYRTLAHELGHLLGLPHVAPDNRLMARGRNGELLAGEEIVKARENMIHFFSSSII